MRCGRYFDAADFILGYLSIPCWDTGIPAPELVRFLMEKGARKCYLYWCGKTGTNSLYLAQQDWRLLGSIFGPWESEPREELQTRAHSMTLLVGYVTKLCDWAFPGVHMIWHWTWAVFTAYPIPAGKTISWGWKNGSYGMAFIWLTHFEAVDKQFETLRDIKRRTR